MFQKNHQKKKIQIIPLLIKTTQIIKIFLKKQVTQIITLLMKTTQIIKMIPIMKLSNVN